jgi:hypothetical protein
MCAAVIGYCCPQPGAKYRFFNVKPLLFKGLLRTVRYARAVCCVVGKTAYNGTTILDFVGLNKFYTIPFFITKKRPQTLKSVVAFLFFYKLYLTKTLVFHRV